MRRAARLPGREAHIGHVGGHIPGLIRRLAAAAVTHGRAKRAPNGYARAFRRRLGQLDLLRPCLTSGPIEGRRSGPDEAGDQSGSRIVQPSPESGPAPATCPLGCARRAISLPDSTRVTLCDRGRPPIPFIECLPLSPCAVPDGHRPGEDGRRSLGTLLRNTREQCTNLSLPVSPVSPQRADRGQFSGLRPSCDGLGVDAKHRGDLRGRQQRLGLWCTCGHVCGLSSWTSVAIPVLLVRPGAPWGACRGCPIWPTETILPSPAVTRRPPGA